MYALIYRGPRNISWEKIEDKEPRSNEVRVQIKSVGICGSDIEGYLGKTNRRIPPMIMGHEMSGKVVELGEGVDKKWLGKRVVIFPVLSCQKCVYCLKGLTNLCPDRKLFGTFNINGGMATHIIIPVSSLIPLSESISYQEGALVEPLMNTKTPKR